MNDKDIRTAYVLICLCRASTPLLDYVILPWVAPFLIDLGVADSLHVGFYTGWLQTVFSFSVVLGVVPATWASDTFGRKPTILFGLVIASVWSILFPFVTKYPLLLVIRGLLGFCTAFVPPTIKTLFIELSDDETRPVFFAMSSAGFSMGLIAAPAFGGLFVKPASDAPSFEGGLFEQYPYALPCVVASLVPICTACASYFFLAETKPGLQSRTTKKRSSMQVLLQRPEIATLSFFGFLNGRLVYILGIWVCGVLLSSAFAQIEPVLYYTPRSLGGLGLTTREGSFFLAMRPLITACWLFLFYPRAARAYGPERVMLCAFGWPILLFLYIGLTSLAQAGAAKGVLVAGLLLAFCLSALTTPMYLACEQVIAKRAIPGHLAKTCAADEILANIGGGCGAALGPSLFAATLGKGFFISKIVWLFFSIWGFAIAIACSRITANAKETTQEQHLEAEGLLYDGHTEEANELRLTPSRHT